MPWPALAARTEGDGAPFVLLHGGVGSSSHWARNIEALARNYRVVAFDLPGYGASPDVPENLEPEQYIDWVAATVSEVAGDGCELAGFSFGGVIAARIAARFGARIQRLSLLAPGGFGVPKGRVISTVKVPPQGTSPQERRKAVAANLASWMLSTLPGSDDEVVDMQIYNIDHARFDSRRVSLRETLLEDLRRMTASVQLMWGARDALAYPSIDARAEVCRAVRPGMPVELIEDAGHWVQFEQPERVNELLLKFHRG